VFGSDLCHDSNEKKLNQPFPRVDSNTVILVIRSKKNPKQGFLIDFTIHHIQSMTVL
jgi:hypothetical protein